MSTVIWSALVYGIPLLTVYGVWIARRRRVDAESLARLHEARSAGLTEPASLHPLIDYVRCVGCGSCVRACPEQPEHHVLGLIGGKAQLVTPTDCIGHGACRVACPVDAITLVFGTDRRGVDIPIVSEEFESNVPGLFIAGELGGMGLIRNALVQGCQAVEAIRRRRPRGGQALDLVIVGAGPAGFAATLAARQHGMRSVTLEQESLGGCVFQYPRGKVVMTAPAELPLIGKVRFRTTRKEDLLEFWRDVERRTGVTINYQERVEAIEPVGPSFIVRSTRRVYRAHSVLLAIGRRGTPRKLDVPGEELPKVVYRLIEPEQYAGQRVLIVGGGDSALEAAASIAELGSAEPTLSYRGEVFNRAKPKNRDRVLEAAARGSLDLRLQSTVRRIEPRVVELEQQGNCLRIGNDAVIVSVGGVLPSEFLRAAGVSMETKFGTA